MNPTQRGGRILTQRRKGAEMRQGGKTFLFFAPLRLCVSIFGLCSPARGGET